MPCFQDGAAVGRAPEERSTAPSETEVGPRLLDRLAYARRIEFRGGDEGKAALDGRVRLVPPDEAVFGSTSDSRGRPFASFGDVKGAQKTPVEDKVKWFREACEEFCKENEGHARIQIGQDHLLEDSIQAVMSFDQTDLKKAWIIDVERGKGSGELPVREWYESVLGQLLCPDAGLWEKCDEDETRVEINFLSGMLRPDHLRCFRFAGRVLGKALLDGRPLSGCRLSKIIYKLLLRRPVVPGDLKDEDLRYLQLLEEMGAEVGALGLHFTLPEKDCLGLPTRVPIVPGGFDISVEEDNLPEYINSCFKYHVFGRCEGQLNEFVLGFFEVVPDPLLPAFDVQELEELMCGSYEGGKGEGQQGQQQQQTDVEAESEEPHQQHQVSEKEDINDRRKQRAVVEEIMNHIFDVSGSERKINTPDASKPASRRSSSSQRSARTYPEEEKVEEKPPEEWNYPISSVPKAGGEDDPDHQVLTGTVRTTDPTPELIPDGTESARRRSSRGQKPAWTYPEEEKVEEEPPEEWDYPISDVPKAGGEDEPDHQVLADIPGYLDAHFRNDDLTRTRGARSVRALNPLEARIQEKQRADDALARMNREGVRVPSSMESSRPAAESSENENDNAMEALVTLAPLRTESTSSSWSPIPVPNALLVEDETLYVAEPLAEAGSNDGEGHVQDIKERRLLIKKGRCPDCGQQTHKLLKGVLGRFKKNYRPLSNKYVLNGRCLICNPKDEDADDRPCPSAPPFDASSECETNRDRPKVYHDSENKYFSRAQSHVEVEHWLLSRLPSLQREDVRRYCDCLASDGFDSLDMLEDVEEGDLGFMKKAHRRALLKRL